MKYATAYMIEAHLAEQARNDLVALSRISPDTFVLEGAIDQCNGTYKLYYRRPNISPSHIFSREFSLPSNLMRPNMAPGAMEPDKKRGFFEELAGGLKKFLSDSERYDKLRQSSVKPVTLATLQKDEPNNKFFTVE